MNRTIEKVYVTNDRLQEMTDTIKKKVRNYNPMTGEADGFVYTNDGVNGYIVQSTNIVLHRADGSLKMWYTDV